jgi:hypothetical protein
MLLHGFLRKTSKKPAAFSIVTLYARSTFMYAIFEQFSQSALGEGQFVIGRNPVFGRLRQNYTSWGIDRDKEDDMRTIASKPGVVKVFRA